MCEPIVKAHGFLRVDSNTMELESDEDLALGLDKVKVGLDIANTDELEQVKAPKNEKRKTSGLALMHGVTRIRSIGEKTVVDYNKNGVSICENGHKLQSFIRSCVRRHIPITHAFWKPLSIEVKEKVYNMVKGAFIVDGQSKKVIMKTPGVAFRQFKSWLTTQHIMLFVDEPQLLIDHYKKIDFP
ncbi:uncharacterized protein E5676_scaffold177G00440 [Cucumis melo var. makuwa]|uniref:Serine/threonine-protein kinase nek2 n=1 Tax=Cucumis melo var. makuwa TaxID=1194695 RepID=A0A5D3CIX7_CUCMM|nr:uncharacterized protein E5676_scaffold177G00440 [Cucumis melo var. makuwa]